MHVERLPRRLWYRWEGGAEIEYSTDIPTPIPQIKCDEVEVLVPPSVPQTFTLWGLAPGGSAYIVVSSAFSYALPTINVVFWGNNPTRYQIGLRVMLWNGVWTNAAGNLIATNWYLTPGDTLQTRRDLLVGGDRIINPTVEAPCPKWRFTGGNCPPGSQDCGGCCLDCASVVAGLDGLTATVKAMTRR